MTLKFRRLANYPFIKVIDAETNKAIGGIGTLANLYSLGILTEPPKKEKEDWYLFIDIDNTIQFESCNKAVLKITVADHYA